jgi:SET domain-containing protein
MRMGIFTKRDIKANEELTFNYNVDRYGCVVGLARESRANDRAADGSPSASNRHVAQECFCGEPNCVGFIGGKTQTDIGGMDDLYIDGELTLP